MAAANSWSSQISQPIRSLSGRVGRRVALAFVLASCARAPSSGPPAPEPPVGAAAPQVPEGFELVATDPPVLDDRSFLWGRAGEVHWEKYFSEHETARALIVATHPEGSNVGELADITRRLLAEGFDVLLIDLCHGGPGWGRDNMTAAACEDRRDGVAAIGYVVDAARYKSLNRPVQWVPVILLIDGITPERIETMSSWLAAVIDVSGGPSHAMVGDVPIVREPLRRGDPERGIPATLDEDAWMRIFTQLEAHALPPVSRSQDRAGDLRLTGSIAAGARPRPRASPRTTIPR